MKLSLSPAGWLALLIKILAAVLGVLGDEDDTNDLKANGFDPTKS